MVHRNTHTHTHTHTHLTHTYAHLVVPRYIFDFVWNISIALCIAKHVNRSGIILLHGKIKGFTCAYFLIYYYFLSLCTLRVQINREGRLLIFGKSAYPPGPYSEYPVY